jgi:hypothetical protein
MAREDEELKGIGKKKWIETGLEMAYKTRP